MNWWDFTNKTKAMDRNILHCLETAWLWCARGTVCLPDYIKGSAQHTLIELPECILREIECHIIEQTEWGPLEHWRFKGTDDEINFDEIRGPFDLYTRRLEYRAAVEHHLRRCAA